MAALDFPNSPTVNQQYNAPNGVLYTWDGAVWGVSGPASGQPAGGDLQGTYPNPTVIPAAKSKWSVSGTTITPTDTTDVVAGAPVPNPFQWGARTTKGRLLANPGLDLHVFSHNVAYNADASAFVQDDATKPSWQLQLRSDTDRLQVNHSPAAGAAVASMWLDGTGMLTVLGPPASAADNATILMGSRTQKGRLQALPGVDWVGMTLNRKYNGTAWLRDDTAQPSWTLALGANYSIAYENAAGTGSTPFYIDAAGGGKTVCTLANLSVTRPMMAIHASWQTWNQVAVNANQTINAGVWTQIVPNMPLTTRGGVVLVWINPGLSTIWGASSICYMIFRRDGNWIGTQRFSAGSGVPIPGMIVVDTGAGAGAHNYDCQVNTNAGAMITAPDYQGLFQAVELS